MKKILTLILIITILLSGIALPQEAVVLASKPEVSFNNRLYFVTTAGQLTLEWTEMGGTWFELQGYHVEGDKFYPLEDLDEYYGNQEGIIKIPRTGHWQLSVRACGSGSETPFCTKWTNGTETRTTDEPTGWWVFARPAAPTGGGIE